MHKNSNEFHIFQKNRQLRLQHKQRRAANRRKNHNYIIGIARRKNKVYFKLKEDREAYRRQFYKKKYTLPAATVKINGDYGIEDEDKIRYFLKISNDIIDFKNKTFFIDFKECTRIWPSAITLLCSLKQWVELSTNESKRPIIGSTSSENNKVNSYLNHCGFYSYVNRPSESTANDYYSDEEIVKIQRETKTSNIEDREIGIVGLLESYSTLKPDDIELFNCIVLTEAFANATEHGVSHRDRGWWLLAQYHKNHGFISLCIADNGIGIRNTLMTGPQANDLKLYNAASNDGKFIKMALEETVSGALYAPTKTAGIIRKRYQRGARRGNGLKRIKETCKKLNIRFSILSQNGYAFLDNNGQMILNGSMQQRIFAGTLCHFVIPAKKGE